MITKREVHVLLVEDNEQHRLLIERILHACESPRYHLTYAGTLADALHAVARPGIEVILLDLSLPDSDGVATFTKIYTAAPHIPIVILSGIGDVTLAIETVQRGAQDYLVKGHVDQQLLLRAIAYSIERKAAQAALQKARDELEDRVKQRTAELEKENTERRAAEERAMESNRQLSQALEEMRLMQRDLVRRERFQALGHMASGIAHEFNNVLTPILGYAEHLLQNEAALHNPAALRTVLEKIRTAAQSGARAVSRVRDFAKAESGELGSVDAQDLLDSVISLTEPKWRDEALAAGSTITVTARVEEPLSIHGNAAQLRELLTHIIFNSVRSVRRRGTIHISARRCGSEALLTVTDDGSGMDAATLAHCLDARACLVPADGHLGGMGIIHGILQRHGGRIEMESHTGKGTTTRIYLALVQETAQPSPITPATPAAPTISIAGLDILVADDEPMVREVIGMYLAEDQHRVHTAENGRVAYEMFLQGRYDCVLTDRSMPEMSGDELALAVKKTRPGTPVFLLTGFGDAMNSEGERPPGVDAIIPKPFTLAAIRSAISQFTTR